MNPDEYNRFSNNKSEEQTKNIFWMMSLSLFHRERCIFDNRLELKFKACWNHPDSRKRDLRWRTGVSFPVLAPTGYIQASRALMIASIVFGSFGIVATLSGMQCSKIGGENYLLKGRIAAIGGVFFLLQGNGAGTGSAHMFLEHLENEKSRSVASNTLSGGWRVALRGYPCRQC